MHSLIHVDESQLELFQCPYKNCSRSYKYKKNLNEHIKVFHEKSKEKLELNCTEPGCQVVVATYVNYLDELTNFLLHFVCFSGKFETAFNKCS